MPESEIEVEGETWNGLVVVADISKQGPGHYGLVQALEWCSSPDNVTVWRGPRKRDEVIPKNKLHELTCRTVLVDARGFYSCIPDPGKHRPVPCSQITEELEQAVEKEADQILDEEANRYAAESTSFVDYERAREEIGDDPDIFATARFGDAIAVNGELATDAQPPHGWERTDLGGRILDGGEAEVEKSNLANVVAHTLMKQLQMPVDPWIVRRILDTKYGRDHKEYIVRGSGGGTSEVWISPRLMSEYEDTLERRAKSADEKARRKVETQRRRQEELERQEREERQNKIKRGGFPDPHDWSPQGKLPWED